MKQLLLFLISMAFVIGGSKAQDPQDFKFYKLKNGLTVVLDRDSSESQVVGIVAANVGAQDEEEDATGLAHYLEHMLFKGTETLGTSDWEKEKPLIDETYTLYDKLQGAKSVEEIQKINDEINKVSQEAGKYVIPNETSKLVEQMGGVALNASTSLDVTEYHNIFPPNQLERWLDLYAHRFEKPVFRLFQTELESVYEEKNRAEDNPNNAYTRKLLENVFKGHPYSRPVLGYTEHLKRPNMSRMRDFFEKWYVPGNMILILSGNFEMEQAETLIAEKFGKWNAKAFPRREYPKIKPFKGKEVVKVKLTPYLKGELVYNTTPESEKEELSMDIVAELLSNSAQTGLLNKLSLEGDVLFINANNESLKDGSIFSISFAPVFDVNQRRQVSFKSVESLIDKQLKLVKEGGYEDWLLEQVKTNMLNEYKLAMENPMVRAKILLNLFIRGKAPQSIFEYASKINTIDKTTVSNVAKKYLGKDLLAFYSYKGEADKEKIEKPNIDPIKPKEHTPSKYALQFQTIPTNKAERKYIDFKKAVQKIPFQDKVTLNYVPNKRNDVFSMTLVFKAGKNRIPMLDYAVDLMNNAGVMAQYKSDELRKEFGKLGVTYSFSADDYNTYVSMEGNEAKLAEACQLLSRLMLMPKIEDKSLQRIVGSVYQGRMIEKRMQPMQFAALVDYIKYKDKSDFLDRVSLKDLLDISPSKLTAKLNEALSYSADIHYYGKMSGENVKKVLLKNLAFSSNRKTAGIPEEKAQQNYDKNTIFLVNNPKSSQSKIFIFVNGEPVPLEKTPLVEAFNQYFSGGFTGLMLKEIREFRSLAYTAGAYVVTPKYASWNSGFYGNVGTQSDKTIDALDVTIELMNNMPEYPKRMSNVKDYLVNSSYLKSPLDRNLSYTLSNWEKKGYKQDPVKQNLPLYEQMKFEDMVKFYKEYLQGKPYVIGIVGNTKSIDKKALEKFGKVIKINPSKLFSKE